LGSERESETIVSLFQATVDAKRDRPALRTKRAGAWETSTWGEWDARARAFAAELVALGVQRGDRVAIFANTREEWVIADVGVLFAGAVTVPIYQTLIGEQAAYILEDSGAKVLVAEDATFLERFAGGHEGTLAKLERIVLVEATKGAPPQTAAAIAKSWSEVIAAGLGRSNEEKRAVGERAHEVLPADLATIIYTSGTTGPPKGVMLTHANLAFETRVVARATDVRPDDDNLLFLPMAHIFAKVLVMTQIRFGHLTTFAESLPKALDNAVETNPTFLGCVPRLYEKIYTVANEKAHAEGSVKARVFDWAVAVGRDVSRAKERGKTPAGLLAVQHRYADKLVLRKIRSRFGTRLRFAISGGAPLARELAEWFSGAGVQILEAYGLTETTGGTTLNLPDRYRFGTVGPTLDGVEVKIASDGEILIRGPNIMRGYWHKEADTREVLDADGWFHSGDIGAFDADGFLRITDRKKDIIVTAGGKNVAPQNIESLLKQSPWISQAMVHGDKRPYLVALLTLNSEAMARFADETGRPKDLGRLAEDGEVRARVQLEIDAVNRRLSQFESVKKFAILPQDFSIETGELTPTLKVKRKIVTERHRAVIDGLYE
jgi:long-chain acyl-CoA synthetase